MSVKKNSLRGEDYNVILSLVRKAEEKNSVLFGQQARKLRPVYYINGWLRVGDDARGRLGPGRVNEAPIAQSDIYAEKIRVKNNVLAIYPDNRLVCKLRRPVTIRDFNSLHNEYSILKKISAFEGLNAPEPVTYQAEPVPTLCLKYIDHKSVGKKEKRSIAYNIAAELMRWYDHCGVDHTTSSSYSPLLDILQRGVQALWEKGWNDEDALLLRTALLHAADVKVPLLQSQIHGDASTGNAMINKNGELIITDWETSRTDLIAIDMVKLFQDAPEVSGLYLDWRSKYVKSTSADVLREFLLVRILQGLNLKDYWHYYTAVTSYDRSIAENRLAADRQSVIQACHAFVDIDAGT